MQEFLELIHSCHDRFIEIRAIPLEGDDKHKVERFFSKDVDACVSWLKELSGTHNIYHGVCPRDGKGNTITQSFWLWADVDTKSEGGAGKQLLDYCMQRFALPPTVIVGSGGDEQSTGLHLYWRIEPTDDLERVKAINNKIADVIKGDYVGDKARILRVPGTWNHKGANPRPVTLWHGQPELQYTLDDLDAATRINTKMGRVIHTGDARGFKSRSERDFAAILEMVKAGMSDDAITLVFELRKIGDKHNGEPGDHYLERSIEKARESLGLSAGERLENTEWGIIPMDGYYAKLSDGVPIRLSTFTLQPTAVLEGEGLEEDVLVCDVITGRRRWANINIPQSAFTKSDKLNQHLPRIEWSWLGTDRDLRRLLPMIVDQIHRKSIPMRTGTGVLGRHGDVFVAPNMTFDGYGILEQPPIVWLPTHREHPKIAFASHSAEEILEVADAFVNLYFQVNRPDVVWPVLGFYVAALYKPVLDVRFPVLSIFGTRGSGKTTLLTQIMQPLIGYERPYTWNANTTNFVLLSLLSSTNAIPVSISEYRVASLRDPNVLSRFILLAYDGGRDSRGRPNQTTVEYHLTTPFTIDGEDVVSDPAALERAIVINMSPEQIQVDTPGYNAFTTLREVDLGVLSLPLVQWTLRNNLKMTDAELRIKKLYPTLPDRIRKNMSVVLAGMWAAQGFFEDCGIEVPQFSIEETITPCVELIVNPESGRTRLHVDRMIEDVVNHVVTKNGTTDFIYTFDANTGEFFFQLTPAYNWWAAAKRREGASILQLSSIKTQLNERKGDMPGNYVTFRGTKHVSSSDTKAHMYGISLATAIESGLDIPNKITAGGITYDHSTRKARFT